MRVVLVSETFSPHMGYLQNCLPKYFARLGADTHLVTMDLRPYYQLSDFQQVYSGFSEDLKPGTVDQVDGFTLHVQGHSRKLGYVRMDGLSSKLAALRPDIVQTSTAIGWIPLDAAIASLTNNFRLFTGSHSTASTFGLPMDVPWYERRRLKTYFLRTLPGRLISVRTEKCYVVTEDCSLIAIRFFGVPKEKIQIMYLGVDNDFFFPVDSSTMEERKALRSTLGYTDDDIVCVYTGKLTETKNAYLLADAVQQLVALGHRYRGLFIGSGSQRNRIESCGSSRVLDFMDYRELGKYYRASDIGVWPTNESTSSLDAAACGLPLVLSDGIVYRAHVEGNGLIYKMNDAPDLVRSLLELRDPARRDELGRTGAHKMKYEFSWRSVAERRLRDYEAAVR